MDKTTWEGVEGRAYMDTDTRIMDSLREKKKKRVRRGYETRSLVSRLTAGRLFQPANVKIFNRDDLWSPQDENMEETPVFSASLSKEHSIGAATCPSTCKSQIFSASTFHTQNGHIANSLLYKIHQQHRNGYIIYEFVNLLKGDVVVLCQT